MYHIITAVERYICISGTQYLIVLCSVNYNERGVKTLQEDASFGLMDTLIVREIEYVLF